MQWVDFEQNPEKYHITFSDNSTCVSSCSFDNQQEDGKVESQQVEECKKCKDIRDGIFSLPNGFYRLLVEDDERKIVDEFLNEYEIVRNKDIKLLKDEIKALNNIIGSYKYKIDGMQQNKKFSIMNIIGMLIMLLGGTGVVVGWFSLVYYYIMHVVNSYY